MRTESTLKIKVFEEFTLLVVPKSERLGELYEKALSRGLLSDYFPDPNDRSDDRGLIHMRHAIRERNGLFCVPRWQHEIPSLYWLRTVGTDAQTMKFYQPYTNEELRWYLERVAVYLDALKTKLFTPMEAE